MNVKTVVQCAACAFLLIASASDAAPKDVSIYRQPWNSWTRTRPLSPGAINLLEEGSERSALLTELLLGIEETDLVVYVTDSMQNMNYGPASYLSFVSTDGVNRYVLIRLDFVRLAPPDRIAWLGHELQHALEVASAPEVNTENALATLYRRIGWTSSQNRYETERAQDVGRRIRSQLDRRDVSKRASLDTKRGVSAP